MREYLSVEKSSVTESWCRIAFLVVCRQVPICLAMLNLFRNGYHFRLMATNIQRLSLSNQMLDASPVYVGEPAFVLFYLSSDNLAVQAAEFLSYWSGLA